MDRRFLFPAVALTAWAQQVSPTAAEAEKALRASAQQFYQLEVDGKFRNAEALVAEDSKDYYFNNGKPAIKSFRIDRVEFSEDGKRANVYLTAKVVFAAPGVGVQEFDEPAVHKWKLENGRWVWYIDQNAVLETPFGKWNPGTGSAQGGGLPGAMVDPSGLTNLVTIDRTSLDLTTGNDSVTITNHLPGVVTLKVALNPPQGLVVKIDKTDVAAGEKAVVSFRTEGNAKPSGTVRISASPINQEFLVQIKTQ